MPRTAIEIRIGEGSSFGSYSERFSDLVYSKPACLHTRSAVYPVESFDIEHEVNSPMLVNATMYYVPRYGVSKYFANGDGNVFCPNVIKLVGKYLHYTVRDLNVCFDEPIPKLTVSMFATLSMTPETFNKIYPLTEEDLSRNIEIEDSLPSFPTPVQVREIMEKDVGLVEASQGIFRDYEKISPKVYVDRRKRRLTGSTEGEDA